MLLHGLTAVREYFSLTYSNFYWELWHTIFYHQIKFSNKNRLFIHVCMRDPWPLFKNLISQILNIWYNSKFPSVYVNGYVVSKLRQTLVMAVEFDCINVETIEGNFQIKTVNTSTI